jgi:hypothetical protein
MESAGLKSLAQKWIVLSEGRPKISKFVHDKDARANVVLSNLHWELEEFLDPNHAKKSIFRQFKAIVGKFGKLSKSIGTILQNWFDSLVYNSNSPFSRDEREVQWLNAAQHLIGNR